MDYLDHLGRVIEKEKRNTQLDSLQKSLQFRIPKFLKIFYMLYQVNDLGKYKKLSHLYLNLTLYDNLRDFNFPFAIFLSEYHENGYDISTFYEFDIIKDVLRNFFNDDFEKYENDFIVIGETSWHFPLMIGINSENYDEVFVYDFDKDKLIFLADNIFEYLMNIKLDFSNNYNLPEGKTVNDLYKNWNEDFWRVK